MPLGGTALAIGGGAGRGRPPAATPAHPPENPVAAETTPPWLATLLTTVVTQMQAQQQQSQEQMQEVLSAVLTDNRKEHQATRAAFTAGTDRIVSAIAGRGRGHVWDVERGESRLDDEGIVRAVDLSQQAAFFTAGVASQVAHIVRGRRPRSCPPSSDVEIVSEHPPPAMRTFSVRPGTPPGASPGEGRVPASPVRTEKDRAAALRRRVRMPHGSESESGSDWHRQTTSRIPLFTLAPLGRDPLGGPRPDPDQGGDAVLAGGQA